LASIQAESALKQNLLDHILVFENYPTAERVDGIIAANEKDSRGVRLEVSDIETFEQTNYDFNLAIITGEQLSLDFNYNGMHMKRGSRKNCQTYSNRTPANSSMMID
jgi:fengycin family lipopeptide synthetase E